MSFLASWWIKRILKEKKQSVEYILFYLFPKKIGSRTKCNSIVWSTKTSKSTSLIIISITISLRTLVLKYPRIIRRRTSFRQIMVAAAAIFRPIKNHTSTFTPNHRPIVAWFNGQLRWTNGVHISRTNYRFALTRSTDWRNGNRQIEAVDEANVEEILAAVWRNGEFHETCRRNCAGAVARDFAAAAVGSATKEFPSCIGGAESSSPKSAGPRRRCGHGDRGSMG